MQMFTAVKSNAIYPGALADCLSWAAVAVANEPKAVVKILKTRPGEKFSRIIAEVTSDGTRWIFGGRVIPAKATRGRHGQQERA